MLRCEAPSQPPATATERPKLPAAAPRRACSMLGSARHWFVLTLYSSTARRRRKRTQHRKRIPNPRPATATPATLRHRPEPPTAPCLPPAPFATCDVPGRPLPCRQSGQSGSYANGPNFFQQTRDRSPHMRRLLRHPRRRRQISPILTLCVSQSTDSTLTQEFGCAAASCFQFWFQFFCCSPRAPPV